MTKLPLSCGLLRCHRAGSRWLPHHGRLPRPGNRNSR